VSRKFAHVLMALALALGVSATSISTAEAGRGGNVAAGVAIGTLLGLGIAGAYAGPRYYGPAYYGPGCYPGPRQCGWSERSCWRDAYGEPVCRGGEWRCWRPTICD